MSFDSHSLNSIHASHATSASHLETKTGTVTKKTIGAYVVQVPGASSGASGQMVTCAISNRLRKELVFPIADPTSFRRRVMAVEEIGAVDPVAVGDRVIFTDSGDGGGMITEVLPRRSKLARQAAGAKPLEQVIVANLDQVVLVFAAAHPEPKWNLLDRYLVSAEASGIPPLICITKLDLLADDVELKAEVENYRRIGYRAVLTSTVTGTGIDAFKAEVHGRMSAFIGKSGVGKTSLLNTIEPGLGLRVNEVSQSTDKGKHTTTHLEMFALQGGGQVVDTPGLREFGLWQVTKTDIALFFPEMRPWVGTCQFGADCGHASEPGCAIKRAVSQGHISHRRYESFLKLAGE